MIAAIDISPGGRGQGGEDKLRRQIELGTPSDIMRISGEIIITIAMYIPSGKSTQLWKITLLLIGKSTINGNFPIAMLNYQRVYIYILMLLY